MKKFFNDFKDFISKGNVIDLAVAVVIGNAFNAIVTSLVNDIIMPFVGIIIGGINFTSIKITYGTSSILIGSFIQNIINFLIIALSIFVVIQVFSKLSHLRKKEEDDLKEKLPPEPPKKEEIRLLEEIRDLLKDRDIPKKEIKKTKK